MYIQRDLIPLSHYIISYHAFVINMQFVLLAHEMKEKK